MKVSSKKFFMILLLSSMIFSPIALAEETQSPVQEVVVDNSYLTRAHIQTNSKTEIQTIKIQKSFLVWVTIRKGKDTASASNNTK